MRPQRACWERQALSLTWETELAVPIAENSSTTILRKQMDNRVWEPGAVLRRTVGCESELDWVKEGFLKEGCAAVPHTGNLRLIQQTVCSSVSSSVKWG